MSMRCAARDTGGAAVRVVSHVAGQRRPAPTFVGHANRRPLLCGRGVQEQYEESRPACTRGGPALRQRRRTRQVYCRAHVFACVHKKQTGGEKKIGTVITCTKWFGNIEQKLENVDENLVVFPKFSLSPKFAFEIFPFIAAAIAVRARNGRSRWHGPPRRQCGRAQERDPAPAHQPEGDPLAVAAQRPAAALLAPFSRHP